MRPNTGLQVTPKRARLLNTGALGPAQLTDRERRYAVAVGNLPPTPDDLRRMAAAAAKRARKAAKQALDRPMANEFDVEFVADGTPAERVERFSAVIGPIGRDVGKTERTPTIAGNYCHRTHQVIR